MREARSTNAELLRAARRDPNSARIIDGLQRLREQLDAEISARSLEKTLRLATWNIREFDSPAYGPRVSDAFYFIAEIISRFDLVAVQEVRLNLDALRDPDAATWAGSGATWSPTPPRAIPATTSGWRSSTTNPQVRFTGLAGELVLPDLKKPDGHGGQGRPARPDPVHGRVPVRLGRPPAGHRAHPVRRLRPAEQPRPASPRSQRAREVPRRPFEGPRLGFAEPRPARRLQHLRPHRRHHDRADRRRLERAAAHPGPAAGQQRGPWTSTTTRSRSCRSRTGSSRPGPPACSTSTRASSAPRTKTGYVPDMGEAYTTTSKGEPRTGPGKTTVLQDLLAHLPDVRPPADVDRREDRLLPGVPRRPRPKAPTPRPAGPHLSQLGSHLTRAHPPPRQRSDMVSDRLRVPPSGSFRQSQ